LNPLAERTCFSQVFAEGARPAPELWKAWDSLGLVLAEGASVIKYKSLLNVLKDTHDHSWCLARSYKCNHLMADSPRARLVEDGVELVGWWEPTPLVTVTEHGGAGGGGENASGPVVFASVYLRQASAEKSNRGGKKAMPRAVISVASWASAGNMTCTLDIDWAKLGLSAATATITASAIAGFQGDLSVSAAQPTIVVPAAKGWLLAVHGPH
jgi:hypothetical protein